MHIKVVIHQKQYIPEIPPIFTFNNFPSRFRSPLHQRPPHKLLTPCNGRLRQFRPDPINGNPVSRDPKHPDPAADFKTMFTASVSLRRIDPRSTLSGAARWDCMRPGRDSFGISADLSMRCRERVVLAAERKPFPVGMGEGGGYVGIRGRLDEWECGKRSCF